MAENAARLGKEKITKLLLSLSLPATVAMMVNGLYNIVDTIFIGKGVGALAIGGLAIAFPIQMLIMGFAQMVGIGAASAVSRNLGAKNYERAKFTVSNAYIMILLLSAVFALFGSVFVNQLLLVFGATEALMPYARDYIRIIFIGSVFFSFAMTSNSLIRAEGNAKVAMTSMIIGAVLNMFLDPIFILIFKMGIKGAALATIISQFASFVFIITYMYSGTSFLKVGFHHLRPKWDIITEITAVGSSAFARQITGTIFAIVVNNSLKVYGGDIAITIFGIVNRVIMFLLMPLIGIGQGMQPIVGYNYGAQKINRVKEAVKISVLVSTTLAVFGWVIGESIPHIIIRIFTDERDIIENGATVLRIIIAMVPFVGIQFVGAILFQAIGKAAPALILSLLRQFIILTPLILVLPRIFNLGLTGIWLAFPIADILAVIITVILIKREMNEISLTQRPINTGSSK